METYEFHQNPLDAIHQNSKQETLKSIAPILEKTIIPEAKTYRNYACSRNKQDEIVSEQSLEIEEENL